MAWYKTGSRGLQDSSLLVYSASNGLNNETTFETSSLFENGEKNLKRHLPISLSSRWCLRASRVIFCTYHERSNLRKLVNLNSRRASVLWIWATYMIFRNAYNKQWTVESYFITHWVQTNPFHDSHTGAYLARRIIGLNSEKPVVGVAWSYVSSVQAMIWPI